MYYCNFSINFYLFLPKGNYVNRDLRAIYWFWYYQKGQSRVNDLAIIELLFDDKDYRAHGKRVLSFITGTGAYDQTWIMHRKFM